ncbi:MAG: hypothetical protein Q7J34_04630 [Bacteroidales bacterium]|nr:hypothetical protein [Bacteroidales bacterium]
MHLYRFRLTCEGEDEFVRDIDITPGSTFELFLETIRLAAAFPVEFNGIFYIANVRWVRQKEIAKEAVKGVFSNDDDDDVRDGVRRARMPFYKLEDAKLRDFMEDPHQYIILEYHANEFKLFYLELLKIHSVDDASSYPKCVVSRGDATYKKILPGPVFEDNEIETILGKRVSIPISLDDIPDDLIEEDIESMLEDDTFSKIIAGETPLLEIVEPAKKRGRKPIEKNSDEEASSSDSEAYISQVSDDDDDDDDYSSEDEFSQMDDDELESSGFQVRDYDD